MDTTQLSGDTWGERLKATREARHLSQAEFGKRLGALLKKSAVHEKTVSRWENSPATARLSEAKLLAAASVLDVSPHWLRSGLHATVDAERPREGRDYYSGVLHAAKTMSETVTRLIGQAQDGLTVERGTEEFGARKELHARRTKKAE